MAELRQAGNWSLMRERPQLEERDEGDLWSLLLGEMRGMARDLKEEASWKRLAARQLANEAMDAVSLQGRRRRTGKPLTLHASRAFYLRALNKRVAFREDHSLNCSEEAEAAQGKRVIAVWTEAERAVLLRLLKEVTPSPVTLAALLNSLYHKGRRARCASDIQSILRSLLGHAPSFEQMAVSLGRRHYDISLLMNSSRTKLVTPRPNGLPKKQLSLSCHPSHEAAARKANQSISKMITPQELALRRLQRSRMPSDASVLVILLVDANFLECACFGSARACH